MYQNEIVEYKIIKLKNTLDCQCYNTTLGRNWNTGSSQNGR